ncbi:MAG: TCP-1/cpn60 chaperonin family protein [Candidatus Diapherotrites archaeon]|uniref:TCP-1/cpn60 chaperonin family protein n=1 Tax=Candidatus Iainarchaeum sp. TaxID=3101447 RepID=A0A8T4L8J0_9ARCH|nr:TCP-1/cpn60 chaperonin family protein [Candidatus Diapherotrites archaeon]
MAEAGQQPVIFLSEGTKRTRGRDAQRINIMVAKAVANAVRSTLGPKGMDKMIVDELGDITISNDGATILKEMSIDHPAGKMMVEVAKTQDDEVGDGTTTAVVFGGTLLSKAESLLDDEIHPSIIVKGYRLAAEKAREFYTQIADVIKFDDVKTLKEIAITSMTGKASEGAEELANLVVQAVRQVAEKEGDKMVIDRDNIKLEKKVGASLHESQLVKGIIVDKEIVHSGMPKKVQNAKIALVDSALEIKSTEVDAKIQISDPDQLQAFLDQEEKMLKNMVDKIVASGANVVFCQKGIDDMAQHFLAKAGISAIRRVKASDMTALAKATDAKVATRLSDLGKDDLGYAQSVTAKKVAGDDMVFVEGCKNPKAVSLLVRGGSEHVVDEAERAVNDAIGATMSAIKTERVLAGGGSSDVEVANKLRDYAKTVGGREQLAIEAFADTLEIIPRTLAETAGMDPLDTIVALRSRHSTKEGKYIGVDVYKGKLSNMKDLHVIEPLALKTQAISSASEVAEMLLRIDDIIAGSSKGPPGGMPGGHGHGGMPGMGDMGEM